MKYLCIFIFFFISVNLFAVDWQSSNKEANSKYKKALKYFDAKDWKKSYICFISATKLDSTFYYAYIGAAISALNYGTLKSAKASKLNIQKAQKIIENLLIVHPNDRTLLSAKVQTEQILNMLAKLYSL